MRPLPYPTCGPGKFAGLDSKMHRTCCWPRREIGSDGTD